MIQQYSLKSGKGGRDTLKRKGDLAEGASYPEEASGMPQNMR